MCAADAVKLFNAQERCGCERFWRGLGGDDDDARDAGHLRGDGGHEQRGRQRVAAAGHITADGCERPHQLAGSEAGDWSVRPGLRHLEPGESADLVGGRGECRLHLWFNGGPRRGHLFALDATGAQAGEAVKLSCVAEEGPIALTTHIGDEAFYGGQHRFQRSAAAAFQRFDQPGGFLPTPSLCPNNLHASSGLKHNLVERIFDDTGGVGSFQARDDFAGGALFNDGVDCYPFGIAELRDGG